MRRRPPTVTMVNSNGALLEAPSVIAFFEALNLFTMSKERFDARFNEELVATSVRVAAPAGAANIAEHIKALHELKIAGALTDAEFAEQKQKLPRSA
jgi:hypothetical protein